MDAALFTASRVNEKLVEGLLERGTNIRVDREENDVDECHRRWPHSFGGGFHSERHRFRPTP